MWYSAIVYGGIPEQAVRFALTNHIAVTSHYLLDELAETLRKKVDAPTIWRHRLIRWLEKRLVLVAPTEVLSIVRDPKDNPVIAAAVAGSCTCIVTGDEDLLELVTWDTMVILTPQQYLQHYRPRSTS